jgi:hypothetical protein
MTTPTRPDYTSIASWYQSQGFWWTSKPTSTVSTPQRGTKRDREVTQVAVKTIDKNKKVKVE